MTEQETLQKYSVSGLRRNALTREGKQWQLWGKGIRGAQAEEILNELYPQEEPK